MRTSIELATAAFVGLNEEGAMAAYAYLFVASALVAVWGVMHLVKTGPVVAGFEPLSDDNRLVLRMEWILEGVVLVFVAVLVTAVTVVLGPEPQASTLVYYLTSGLLVVMAVVSSLTGARATLLPYKLCAPIFATAAVLILMGSAVA
jgi:hypothetical protein